MKSNHILGSLMIIAIIAVLPILLYQSHAKFGGGLDLFILYFFFWIVLSITTPFWILVEKFGVVPDKLQFLSTSLTLLNLFFGLYGLHLIFFKQLARPSPFITCLLVLNLVWGILLLMTLRSKKRNRSHT
jgi:hypothetical protein